MLWLRKEAVMNPRKNERFPVLGAYINHIAWDEALKQILAWGWLHESRYICICNVHSVVTANRDSDFNLIINNADMATPDGAPVAWLLRHVGFKSQERINGPDLMWRYLKEAERLGQSPYFYGGTEETLLKLTAAVKLAFPGLRIAGTHAPPFTQRTLEEQQSELQLIRQSAANVVFVGLGCPKQERWMAAHSAHIDAVMIGVGAAFDYHAGTIKRAPLSWQKHGFEWLYRLLAEPRRLFKRYLITNTLFILGVAGQLLRWKIKSIQFIKAK
jgi:N-acetylglucosaminyldiphosphoundecaprenol N-acetyl-beta-D-mannosaminyltransferase